MQGPNESKRQQSSTYVWGEVVNSKGDIKTARLVTANGYDLTVTGALGIVENLLNKEHSSCGFQTASSLMGANYVCTLPGSSEITLS